MTRYYRIMCGKSSVYAEQCFKDGFVGVDWFSDVDLTNKLPEKWKDFNHEFIPVYLQNHPGKSKVAAGLACGMTWTVARGLQIGDVVLSPTGDGSYRIGKVSGDYTYATGEILCHRRNVTWLSESINRANVSQSLRNSIGSIGTVSECSSFAEEIEGLIAGKSSVNSDTDESTVDSPTAFAMEKYLEEFLFSNWTNTDLGKNYDLYKDEETAGRQVITDAGIIDLLAVSKDKKEILVIELKRGRPSDEVVGQVTRYMGYMTSIAEPGQSVKGMIIAFENDSRIQHSLRVVPNIDFYRYEVDFRLKSLKE